MPSAMEMAMKAAGPEKAMKNVAKEIEGDLKPKKESNINWVDYNYPPCMNLFHYDPTELPSEQGTLVKCMNSLWMLVYVVNILNFVDAFVIYFSQQKGVINGFSMVDIMYSGLNLLLMSPLVMFVFYQGYKGVAMNDSTKIKHYKIAQFVLAALFLFLSISKWGPSQGFLRFAGASKPAGYAIAAIVMESVLWLVLCFFSIFLACRSGAYLNSHEESV